MVRPVVALVHLHGGGAQRQSKHLVSQANAEHRQSAGHQLLDFGHRIGAGGGGIAVQGIARELARRHTVHVLTGAAVISVVAGGGHMVLGDVAGGLAQ